MLCRWTLYVILFAVLSGSLTTRADDASDWTAWLRYGRHMTLVNSAGESLREVELPLPEGYELSERTIAVSPSGRRVAYLVRDSQNAAQVLVYDTENAVTLLQYPLEADGSIWGTSWFSANGQIFNANESVVAFGYTIFHEATGGGDWRLIALDLASGTPLYQLCSDDLIQRKLIPNYLFTPIIRRYQGTEITFTLDILENDGNPTSFVWNTATGDIRPTVMFPNLQSDLFLPTGEIVSPIYGGSPTPIPENHNKTNTLDVYDPIAGGRYPFYQFTSGWPERVSFIQNGETILIQSTDLWILLRRDGVVVNQRRLPPNIPIFSLKGIPNGFLYTTMLENLPDQTTALALPALMAVNTRTDKLDAGRPVWHLSFQEYAERASGRDVPLEIVWEHDDAPLPAYKPWAQLAEPIYEPTPTAPENLPQPTMIPTPEPLFHTGMVVRVQTIGGEILNLRGDHTRKAGVIMYLENKMELTLLEGPVEAEGFRWWHVRTEDGVEGWTVENNDDLQTLMPA